MNEQKKSLESLECGLVMPISPIDGCSAEHWAEVKSVLIESIESIKDFNFKVRLVSDADDVGIIQKRIVQNLYDADIVVCDVSGKNPNVMFELGMRLAFDKPTVIVKDDKTDYSFDTGVIEHVPYPRDLRFQRIVSFKNLLADEVIATYKAAKSDPEHSTFLKSFGKFKVAKLTESEVSPSNAILDILSDLQRDVSLLRRNEQFSLTNEQRNLSSSTRERVRCELVKRLETYGPRYFNEARIETFVNELRNTKDFLNIPTSRFLNIVEEEWQNFQKEYVSDSNLVSLAHRLEKSGKSGSD
jgi:hypothetical protein